MLLSNGRLSRRALLADLPFCLAGVSFAFAAPAREKKKKPHFVLPPPADLPGHVEYLAHQLLTIPLDESEPITGQIQQLVISHLQDWITKQQASATPLDVPFDVRVRREMENAFSQLDYPLFAYPIVFSQSWKGGVLTGAGYTLGWSDYDRVNVVSLFESKDGITRLAGLDPFVLHTDLHFGFPSSSDSTRFRFLVYGTRLGKSQLRLSAILYGYDGQSLKSLWEARDVYDGKLEVEKDSVAIRYLKEDEYVQALTYNRKPPRHLAVYKSSPEGLTLESDREIPF
jgi:hypothetical protein